MLVKYVKDFSLFFLLFVSFDTHFAVELSGEFITKLAVAQFLLIFGRDFISMLLMPKSRVIQAFYFFFVIFLVISVLSNILYFNNTLTIAITRLTSMILVFIYFSYTKELDKVLYMLWVIMLISSAVAYFSSPLDLYTFRKTGATEDPNEFAAQILLIMFATIYLFQKNKNWFFLLGSLGIFSYTLLYAGSKSSFIFLVLILGIASLVKFRTVLSSLFSIKGLVVVIVLVIALGAGAMNSSKAVEGLQGRAKNTGTLQQRFIVWRAGAEMIRDNFYMGVGFGEFSSISGGYIKDFIPKVALPAHNNFIKIFAESGVFTFLAFAFFTILLFSSRLGEIVDSEYFWLYLASLSVFLMGLTIPSLHHKDYWISLAILSNIILMFQREEELQQTQQDIS